MSVKLLGVECPNCSKTSSFDIVDGDRKNCKYCHKDFNTHRTKLKCIVNPILRFIQFYTWEPFVIVSLLEKDKFIGYTFKRMKYYTRTCSKD